MCHGESSWYHLRADKSIELSPAIESLRVVLLGPHLPSTGEGDTSANGNLCSALRQIGGEGGELFLCLLCLNCLQLKIILLPKWHIFDPLQSKSACPS